MYIHSARHVDTVPPAPFLSIDLVSRSSRSSVYVCRFAGDALPNCAYCLKTLRAAGPYLEHQRNLLTRLVESSRLQGAEGEATLGLPCFVASGTVSDPHPYAMHEELLYLLSTWVEGVPLSHIIARRARDRRPLLLAESLSLLLAVAVGLCALGRCGDGALLVHQDLKPSNIIVSPPPDERAFVIDFDTAFFLGEPTEAVPCGSYGYTAPEGIARAEGWENRALDVFSFGVVAHEVLTGRWPYPFPPRLRDDLSFWAAYFREGGGPRVDPHLPGDVRQLVKSCIALDPSKRPSVSELVERVRLLAARYAGSSASCPLAEFAAPLPTPVSAPQFPLNLPPDRQSKSVAQ